MPIHDIDVCSGAVAFDQVDVGLPGVLPLSWIRHYSTSNLLRVAELGPGWSHNFDHRLVRTLEGWQYIDERGNATSITGDVGSGIELRAQQDGSIWLRRYTSGNPRLWLVFESRRFLAADIVHEIYVLTQLRLTDTQRIVLHHDTGGRVVVVQHMRSGRTLRPQYDVIGRVSAVWMQASDGTRELGCRYGYDEHGRLVEVFDRIGLRVSFEYDEWNCITAERKCTGSDYAFEYDGRCRCIHTRGTDGFEERWLAYDDGRRTTKVTDKHGNAWTYVGNAHGQVTLEVDPTGAKTRRIYDDEGRLVRTVSPLGKAVDRRYDELGRLTDVVDPGRRRQWTISYDEEHRPWRVRLPTGTIWMYDYDALGFPMGSVGPHGHRWKYFYNEHAEWIGVSDPLGGVASRTYDESGDMVRTTTAKLVREYEYDPWGRPVLFRDQDGRTTKRAYGTDGYVARVDLPDGQHVAFERDRGGRVTRHSSSSTGDWTASWLPCGCPTQISRPDGSSVFFEWGDEPAQLMCLRDEVGKEIRWEYDALGRPIRRQHYDGTAITFEFDAEGNPIRSRADDGRGFDYVFDQDHNLVACAPVGGGRSEFTYDILDRLISAKRADVELVFERDAYGVVVRETVLDGGVVQSVLRRDLDALGRPTRLQIGKGYETNWTWRGASVAEIEHGPDAWVLEHDDMGRLRRRTTQTGSLQQLYGDGGKLLRQFVEHEGRRIYEVGYAYGSAGHLGEIHEVGRTVQSFSHDDRGRISFMHWTRDHDGFELDRHYDAAGNLCKEVLFCAETTSELDNEVVSNRSERVWDPYRDVPIFYEYDALGRLVCRREPERKVELQWDEGGLLLAAIVDGQRWEYRYDPFGRRIGKTAPGGASWRYVWDDKRIASIVSGDGSRIDYVYEPYGHSPVAFRTDGRTWDLLHRPQGSCSTAVDDRGRIVDLHAHLDPWGRALGEVTTSPRMGFPGCEGFLGSPGQIFDPETGLYYNLHRYYDPLLSKFISPDPIGLVGGLNEYAHVPNPLEWIDPLGLAYVNGGPLPWRPRNERNGRPDLSDPNNRYVDAGGERVVKKRNENDNGKCLAVVDGVPTSALPPERGFADGDTPAFISGFGDPYNTPDPADFDVTRGQMGNWCHSEIQALWFLVQNDISGATIWVDRPPCSACAGDLDAILAAHFPGGDGRSVTVMYFDEQHGWESWDDYKKRKKPPCGG